MADFPFKPAENAESARWLVERLTTFGEDVLSIVPSGFEAYARVFHPASRVTYISDGGATSTSEPLRWSEVAALTGRRAHRAMQWPSVQGVAPSLYDYTTLRVGDVVVKGPEEGGLPLEVARTLWPLLRLHTQTCDSCFFAVWEGFGGMPTLIHKAPAFEIPARRFYLFEAPIRTIEQSFYVKGLPEAPGSVYIAKSDAEAQPAAAEIEEAMKLLESLPATHQSANLWWPEDRAWCVATEIDFNTAYIAGTQGLVEALLACEELEVYQVEPTDGVAYDGDTLNPTPDDPYGGSFRLILR